MARRFTALILSALALGGAGAARADYPERDVTIVVPTAPGGTTDLTARLLAEQLTPRLGRTFVVENKSGATGNVGTTAVARAEPDGYTLLLAYSGYHVANPALFPTTLNWHPIDSFEPVAMAIKAGQVIAARKDFPANDLKELVAYAKANPGKVTYGSSGIGSIQHIGSEQLALLTDTKMTHVPYRGAGPATQDLLGGQLDLLITTPPAVVGFLKKGSVKAIALAAAKRHPMMPDVPTTAEAGVPDYEVESWFGVFAPKGTPKPILDRLAKEIDAIVKTPEFQRKAQENGAEGFYMPPDQLAAYTKEQLAYWADLIKRTGIKLE